MGDGTKIEWTDATWNVINGCSVVSPGCAHCYAMHLAGTRLKHDPSRAGLTIETKAGPVWNGTTRLNEKVLLDPIRWKRPRRIFVCAHGDLFHDSVPDAWIDQVFAVMALAPQHRFQVLTKRADRMRKYVTAWHRRYQASAIGGLGLPGKTDFILRAADLSNSRLHIENVTAGFKNIWLGVSVEDQARANARIPDLLGTPAAVRFLSCEPLLGPLDLEDIAFAQSDGDYYGANALTGSGYRWEEDNNTAADSCEYPALDWVIAGSESGPGARPMHPDWVRSLRDQCADAGVPFFFKQWGEFAPGEVAADWLDPEKAAKGLSLFDGTWSECWSKVDGHVDDEPDVYRIGKKRAGRLLDGVAHEGMPVMEASRG